MNIAKIAASVAAASLVATPVLAAPANPAASLSLSNHASPLSGSVRVGKSSHKKNGLAGAALIIAIVAVGAVAGGIAAVASDSN